MYPQPCNQFCQNQNVDFCHSVMGLVPPCFILGAAEFNLCLHCFEDFHQLCLCTLCILLFISRALWYLHIFTSFSWRPPVAVLLFHLFLLPHSQQGHLICVISKWNQEPPNSHTLMIWRSTETFSTRLSGWSQLIQQQVEIVNACWQAGSCGAGCWWLFSSC